MNEKYLANVFVYHTLTLICQIEMIEGLTVHADNSFPNLISDIKTFVLPTLDYC